MAGDSLSSHPRAGGKIRAVTFDVGGTLIEPWPSVGHIYAAEAARHGVPGLSAEVINRQFAAAWNALDNFRYTRAEWARLVDAAFDGLTEISRRRKFFSALYARFARAKAWRVFPDVRPLLNRLAKRGVRLGIVSNWDRRLRPLLRDLDLHTHFAAIVVSCDLHICKPAPGLFLHVARKFGLPPETILHVGDNLALDVYGAESAGFRALWLRRHRAARAARVVRSLAEVEAHVI